MLLRANGPRHKGSSKFLLNFPVFQSMWQRWVVKKDLPVTFTIPTASIISTICSFTDEVGDTVVNFMDSRVRDLDLSFFEARNFDDSFNHAGALLFSSIISFFSYVIML